MPEPNAKPTLCLDFDGVIHSYLSGWQGEAVIPDLPVPGAIEYLERASDHFQVAIHTSRFSEEKAPEAMTAVADWLVRNGVLRERITVGPGGKVRGDAIYLARFKPPAFITLDDRALTFDGTFPDPESLLGFKPWNKR